MALAGSTGLGSGAGRQLDSSEKHMRVTARSNHVFKMIQRSVIIFFTLKIGRSDVKIKNITDISQKTLRIADLQGKTSYHLVLRAYTNGGMGPEKSMFVVTKENCELNIAIEMLSKCIVILVIFIYEETPSLLNFTFCCSFIVGKRAVLKGHEMTSYVFFSVI